MAIRFLDQEPQALSGSKIRFLDEEPASPQSNATLLQRLASGGADVGAGMIGAAPELLNDLAVNPVRQAFGYQPLPSPTQSVRTAIDEATGGYTKIPEDAQSVARINRFGGSMLGLGGIGNLAARSVTAAPAAVEAGLNALKISTPGEFASAAGATAGYGTAEAIDPESEGLKFVGATAGGLIPGLAQGAGKGIGALSGAAKRLANGKTAEELVADVVRKNPEAAEKLLASQGQSLIDTSKETQALGRTVRKMGGEAEKQVTNFLEDRSASETKRIAQLLQQEVSGKEYFSNLDEIQTTYRAAAAPVYEKAFAQEFKPSPEMARTIQGSPTLKAAFKKAASDLADEGLEAPAGFSQGVDTRTADFMKEYLDNQINKAVKNEDNRGVFQLTKLKNRFLEIADKQNPLYPEARKVAADYNALVEAQKFGSNYIRYKPEVIKQTLDGYSESQREAALIGLREAIETAAGRSTEQGSATGKFYSSVLDRERIKEFFDTPESFQRFDKALKEELRGAQTKNTVLGGSNTDYNLAREAAQGIPITKGEVVSRVLDSVRDEINSRVYGLNKKNAAQIAKILTERERAIQLIEGLDLAPEQKTSLMDAVKASSSKAINNSLRNISATAASKKSEESGSRKPRQ